MELALGARRAVEDHLVLAVVIEIDQQGFPAFGPMLRLFAALLARHALMVT